MITEADIASVRGVNLHRSYSREGKTEVVDVTIPGSANDAPVSKRFVITDEPEGSLMYEKHFFNCENAIWEWVASLVFRFREEMA